MDFSNYLNDMNSTSGKSSAYEDHPKVKFIDVDLDTDKINFIIDNIRNDASWSEYVRTSMVNNKVSSAESYSPDMWGDTLYNEIFDKIDSIVNPSNKLVLDERWCMLYTDGKFTGSHNHDEWDLVAIYYISAPEGSGMLIFPEINVKVKPYTGLLVIHDAKLFHKVKPNTIMGIERFCMVLNYRKRDESL